MNMTSAVKVVRPIVRTHSKETPLTLAILNFVAVNEPCRFEDFRELYQAYKFSLETEKDDDNLRQRLRHLVSTQRLCTVLLQGEYEFSLGLCAYSDAQNRREKVAVAGDDDRADTTTAMPDRYDRLRSAVYVPPVATCPRAGALDYKRCASVGHRC